MKIFGLDFTSAPGPKKPIPQVEETNLYARATENAARIGVC